MMMVTLKTMVMMTKTLTSTTLICLSIRMAATTKGTMATTMASMTNITMTKTTMAKTVLVAITSIVQFRHPRSLLYDLSGSRVIVHWLGTSLGFISGLSR